jgi:hypothetical protein
MCLNCGQFGIGALREVGLESVFNHGGMSRRNKVEVKRMAVGHREEAP